MIRAVSAAVARRRRDDEGAYAILYAVVIVAVLAIAALVVDTGMVRAARRANRSASDAAAIAGAGKLGIGGTNPIAGCQAAMRYAELSLGVTTPGSDNCASTFAGNPVALCTAGVMKVAFETVAGRTIYVGWPVPDSSVFMTNLDLEHWPGNPTTQPAQSAEIDGTACIRMGVAIQQSTGTPFGTGLGLGKLSSTESRSVAKTIAAPGGGEVAAPLVVLDQRACGALRAVGSGNEGGGVVVHPSVAITLPDGTVDQSPGVIAVDSDGTQPNGPEGCSGGATTITVSGKKQIWALDGATTFGLILDFAILTGNVSHAYSGDTTGCPASGAWAAPPNPPPYLCRVPTAGGRVTDLPWLSRYDCGTTRYQTYTNVGFTCTQRKAPAPPYPTPRNYVDQWEDYAKNVISNGGGAFNIIPGTVDTPSGTQNVNCKLDDNLIATSDVYVNCPTLSVNARVSFMGKVVMKGGVDVANGACLMFNDSTAGHCTSLPPAVNASAPPPDGGNVYIDGGLNLSGSAAFVDNQSFIFLGGQLTSSSSGVVSWVAPYASYEHGTDCQPSTSVTVAPSSGCFNSLAMWSPYAGSSQSPDNLTGGSLLNVDGTLFMGYSAFDYNGQGENQQTRAQFVARLVNLTGGSLLNMTPDGSRSTLIPVGAGQLIR